MLLKSCSFVYGLAIAGRNAVHHVLLSTLANQQLMLNLFGYKSVRPVHLNRSILWRVD